MGMGKRNGSGAPQLHNAVDGSAIVIRDDGLTRTAESLQHVLTQQQEGGNWQWFGPGCCMGRAKR